MEEHKRDAPEEVQMIPLDRIRVMNPRARDPKRFKRVVASIGQVGLKKPITVSLRGDSTVRQDAVYDLVCGQGRLEAFHTLGESEIPAIVVSASKEDRLVMSLVENLARRQPARFEHVVQIARLRDEGYTATEIGAKVGLSGKYVGAMLTLWDKGEERLVLGAEEGRIPVSMACAIAQAGGDDDQRILTEAYESGKLVGKKLIAAKKLLDQRRLHGKDLRTVRKRRKSPKSADALVRSYQQETQRQRVFVKKAKLCEMRLGFVVSAVRELVGDEDFVNLLRAEGLATLPRFLAEQAGIDT